MESCSCTVTIPEKNMRVVDPMFVNSMVKGVVTPSGHVYMKSLKTLVGLGQFLADCDANGALRVTIRFSY